MDLKEVDLVNPQENWYYQSKLRYLVEALREQGTRFTRLMDIGAGSGFFAEELIHAGLAREAICVDPNYPPTALSDRGPFKKVTSVDREQIASADLFLFIDVLEHVADDQALLTEYAHSAQRGSVFAITVPAFQSLWSGHDIFLEHYRRYRLRQLREVITSSDLTVKKSQYLFTSLFPLAYLHRRIRPSSMEVKTDMSQPSPIINKTLVMLCKADRFLPTRSVMGLSAFVLAEKK